MNAAHGYLRHLSRAPSAATIEAACIVAALATALALLTLLPYDDIVRNLLCFRFHAGQGCAY